jgi:BirA family transcriptional regulator, biotin operon repressor / biotin---[acetyl-CoA-carboxylase] ligase
VEAGVLTRDDLLRALGAIHVTAPVRADEVTPSTNETAAAMAEDGAPQWTLAAAAHQTHGRARMGRTWQDVAGKALMCSVVLRPSGLAANRAGLLSLLAGASMADAIRSQAGRRVQTKWPNDLLLDGKKVGGVLLESAIEAGTIRYVVVGMGVNQEAPEGVEGAGGIGEVSMRDVLTAFLTRFKDVYTAVEPSFPERVRVAWLPTAATIGQLVEATTTRGEVARGRAVGIDDFGALRLSTDHGELKVGFGDVQHLDEAV